MPARHDHDRWSKAEQKALATCSAKGWTAEVTADALNNRFHGGEPIRSGDKVINARQRYKVKVAKIKRPREAVQATESVAQTLDLKDEGAVLTATSYGSEVRTIDELIARAKIDLTKYEVDRPETSMYETSIRDVDGKARKVQNFRIVARFRLKQGPNVEEQVAALIAGAMAKRPVHMAKMRNVAKGDANLMQAVVIADPHLAKYAWATETGWQDYDLDIASRLVSTAAHELMAWGDERKPAVRYIVGLGDLLHYDNPQGTTSGGTPQDRDTRLAKMLAECQSVLCGIVERSAAQCETRVVLVPGNHDRQNTIAMQMILAAYFRGDARVSVDIAPTQRKYVEWGACLLGLTHGDTARKRLGTLMQVEQKEAWGRSKVREWHHGHFHSEAQTITDGGVTIRQHLSLSPPDSWHSTEGYVGAPRGMDSYLYHRDGFLRGTWRSPVLDG